MSTKRKASSSGAKFAPPTVKSTIKVPAKAKIDESKTAVSGTNNVQSTLANKTADTIDISSDSESDSEVDDDDDGEAETKADSDDAMNGVETEDVPAKPKSKSRTHQISSKINGSLPSPGETPRDAADNGEGEEEEEDDASPSFGELLRGTIDVPALLSTGATSATQAATTTGASNDLSLAPHPTHTALEPPSLSSLSTVLAQALRTEDGELLESCLQVTNLDSIQRTVERLDPTLAGVLLSKLAARFHRRPGRAGSLMVWVKWTLVAHGGALAVQPKVLDRLVSLQKVLNERSRGLPSLLALKGKLDMLDAQMQLRQGRRRHRRRGADDDVDSDESEDDDDDDDDQDDEAAIYVEGDIDGDAPALANGVEADEDEGALGANGFAADSDVDDDEDDLAEIGDSDDEDDGEGDSLDEDEVDHDDVEDSMSDDDSDAEAAPPSKVQKTTRGFGKRR